MKSVACSSLLVLGLGAFGAQSQSYAASAPSAPTRALKIGDPAPVLAPMAWIKGEPVERFLPGRVYVVEFWATWCGPCRRMMPHLSALARAHAADLTVVAVNVREVEGGSAELAAVSDFVRKQGATMDYTVAMDDPAEKAVFTRWMSAGGSYGIPTAFIIGRDGRLAWMGYPGEGGQRMGYPFDEALADVLAGRSDPTRARAVQERVNRETAERLEKMRVSPAPPHAAR